MQKEVKEKLLNILKFFNLNEKSLIFNDKFNIWLINIDDNFWVKDSIVALEYIIHQLVPQDIFIKVNFKNSFNKLLDSLQDEVNTVFNQAKYYNQPIAIQPKSAFERRLMHIFIENNYGVKHESIGDGENRQIVIYPN